MVNNLKINKLYDEMIKVDEISTKEIKNLDFNGNDISELVDTGIITRVRRGYYIIGDVSKLYGYGRLLIELKRREDAMLCFEKCFQIDNTNVDVAHQLFINSVKINDCDKAIVYFDVLYQSDPNSKRYLFYLYLLSFIVDLPDKYKDIVSNITYDDLKYEEDSPKNKYQNYIIGLVMNGKLPYAFSKKNNIIYFEDYADRIMLKEATANYAKYKASLEALIRDAKYVDAINLLKKENEVRNLSIYNSYLMYLMEDILSIQETSKVKDVVVVEHTINMFNAINNNNYELALELCIEHNEKINLKNEDNMMFILLSRIVELKKQYVTTEDVVVLEEVINEEVIPGKEVIPFSDIVSSLVNNDINFNNVLYDYLDGINLVGYYDFIIKLIELANIDGKGYTGVLIVLTQIVNGSYVFDSNYYIRLFYESIGSNELDKANIYLDILEMSDSVYESLIQDLRKVMDVLVIKNEEMKKTVQCDVVEKPVKVEESVPEVRDEVVFTPVVQREKVQRKEYVSYSDEDEKFVREKLELLNQNRGIIVLRPMDSERRKNIHHIVDGIRQLNSFSIGRDDNRRIVLRHNGCKFIDFKNVIKEADSLFYSKKYKEALELYLDILGINNPKTFIYAKIGLTYLKMNNIENAIMYLTVATELAKVNNEDFDFSDLIASLDGTIPEHEKKPKFRMKEEEFVDDLSDNFGVDKFEEMYAYVTELDMSLEDACEQLEFTNEEYQLSLLLIARRYYSEGSYVAGDNYLKKVEKLDGKTKKVINKLDEIRRNKKFYVHRIDSPAKTI